MQKSDYANILAAGVNLDVDYQRIAQEILDCESYWKYIPPAKHQIDDGVNNKLFKVEHIDNYNKLDYLASRNRPDIVTRELRGSQIFYLRKSSETDRETYAITKDVSHESWSWREELPIPYTKQVIESLPYKSLGGIRVFIFKDTFLPTHKDYGFDIKDMSPSDKVDRCLGLSIIPSTGGVPMKIWSSKLNRVVDVHANCMLFNDSVYHGVPMTTGYRITIRIFGEIDYTWFANKFTEEYYEIT